MKCPKCDGEMEEGLLVDRSFGGAQKATWVRGNELPTIKITAWPPGIEITGKRHTLSVFRCTSCGFLEAYAKGEA